MLSGRDPSAMLAALAPAAVSTVVACQPDSPRALPAADLADAGRALGLTVHVEPSVHRCPGAGARTGQRPWSGRRRRFAVHGGRRPRRDPGRRRALGGCRPLTIGRARAVGITWSERGERTLRLRVESPQVSPCRLRVRVCRVSCTCGVAPRPPPGRRGLLLLSSARGSHPCHCEARWRRAWAGRRDRRPAGAQGAALGGCRAANGHAGAGARRTTPSTRNEPFSPIWWRSSPVRPFCSWWWRARRTPTPSCAR